MIKDNYRNYKTSTSNVLLTSIFVSLCFSLRLSTFLVLLYAITILLSKSTFKNIQEAFQKIWVVLFLFLFLLHGCSLLWSEDMINGLFVLEKKASLIAIPILIAIDKQITSKTIDYISLGFIFGCCLALTYCLIFSSYRYFQLGTTEVFFYHNLTEPLDHLNAIYFSYFLSLSLVLLFFLSNKRGHYFNRAPSIKWLILSTLCIGIILLSSKLFIFLLALLFLFSLLTNLKIGAKTANRGKNWLIGLALLLLSLIIIRPVQNRFSDLYDSQFEVLQLQQFRYDTPFNSLTLRLLFLKFGWEILAQNKAIFLGVGVGDAQNEMNATIISYNLYHGNPALNDRGYLDYDFHNQWMELWVQAGVLAPITWMIIIVQGFYYSSKYAGSDHTLFFILIILLFLSLTESFLERQRGVLSCVLLLSLFFKTIKSNIRP